MLGTVDKFLGEYESIHDIPHLNQFLGGDDAAKQGGNPLATYISMIYDLAPEDALIIEMAPVEARYWSFQTGTIWSQTTDFTYHQSSINGHQAELGEDGYFRAVLSLQDPGVPNWIDPAGIPTGMLTLRFYKFREAVVPTVKKISLQEVRDNLPKNTPVITADQRRVALARRTEAALQRYGK